jgi:hypothetical protein
MALKNFRSKPIIFNKTCSKSFKKCKKEFSILKIKILILEVSLIVQMQKKRKRISRLTSSKMKYKEKICVLGS